MSLPEGSLARRIRIGGQRTLWGSCSARGTLSFNWRLVLCEVNRIAAARLRRVAGEELRRAHLMVRVGGEDVAITWATRNEILKFLQRAPGALHVVLYFENVGARRPVDLDHDGKQLLFRALTYWHDHPAIGKPFPDDAQNLLTALAGDLAAIAP